MSTKPKGLNITAIAIILLVLAVSLAGWAISRVLC